MLAKILFRSILTVHRSPTCRGMTSRATRSQTRPLQRSTSAKVSFQQHRGYRVIHYRQLLSSWNAIRLWYRDPMFYYSIAGIGLLWAIFYNHYLERVPLSDRLRFNIVSENWERQLAKRLYQEYSDRYRDDILAPESSEYRTARRVFDRMVPYSGLPEAEWDMTVFEEPDHSAFVLPGGKVFISTGMINYCKNDDEIAAVFGHEMAHNIAHHSGESISRNVKHVPTFLISCLVTGLDPELVDFAIDVGFRLPGSRTQEKEADYLGLLIMAQSGYNPSACLRLWSRWAELDVDDRPSYMSTHPSHLMRTNHVGSWLRQASEGRLSDNGYDDNFRERYYLQCSFCGLK